MQEGVQNFYPLPPTLERSPIYDSNLYYVYVIDVES
jgi:hypothetical protein